METRYAIYYAPAPETPLWQRGSAWLGRDAAGGHACTPPALSALSPSEIDALTARPRRYGFHATLKAPFRMTAGRDLSELRADLRAFAGERRAFDIRLAVGQLSGFLALVMEHDEPRMQDLAADCVRAFEPYRAPLSESEHARRASAALSPRQQALLDHWGYPYVMEEFRFHMTLTCSLPRTRLASIRPHLRTCFAPVLPGPVGVDALCLFVQEQSDTDFHLLERFPLGGA